MKCERCQLVFGTSWYSLSYETRSNGLQHVLLTGNAIQTPLWWKRTAAFLTNQVARHLPSNVDLHDLVSTKQMVCHAAFTRCSQSILPQLWPSECTDWFTRSHSPLPGPRHSRKQIKFTLNTKACSSSTTTGRMQSKGWLFGGTCSWDEFVAVDPRCLSRKDAQVASARVLVQLSLLQKLKRPFLRFLPGPGWR